MFSLRPHQQRACESMRKNEKGTVIIPTGGGKTMCMIQDTLSAFDDSVNRTVVVVAPRILLAEQLCSEFLEHITNVSVLHVHSGGDTFFSAQLKQSRSSCGVSILVAENLSSPLTTVCSAL